MAKKVIKLTKRQSFLKDVEAEVKALKKNATKEELANLDFEEFDPTNIKRCIYGQMTGSCKSPRAKELMDSACIRVFNLGYTDIENAPVTEALKVLNGGYEGQTWNGGMYEGMFSRSFNYLSALEGYIATKNAKNKHILAFLKDRSRKIKLKLL